MFTHCDAHNQMESPGRRKKPLLDVVWRQKKSNNNKIVKLSWFFWGLCDCCSFSLRCGALMVGSEDSTWAPMCPLRCQSFGGSIRGTLAGIFVQVLYVHFGVLHSDWHAILQQHLVTRHEIPQDRKKTFKKSSRLNICHFLKSIQYVISNSPTDSTRQCQL